MTQSSRGKIQGTDEVTYDIVWGHGCNYAVIEDAWIMRKPVHLNGHIIHVGDRFKSLGNRRNSARFEMQNGHFLQYEGWADDALILFSSDGCANSTEDSGYAKWYFAFYYISDKVLYYGNGTGGTTVEWR